MSNNDDPRLRRLDETELAALYWPDPQPLQRRELARPQFPIEALPLWLADYVHAVAVFTQTPVDLAASLSLAALATAAGGRTVVEVRAGWREPTNLYVAVALPPGNRKSQVFDKIARALYTAERAAVESSLPDILNARNRRNVAEEQARRYQSTAAKAKSEDRRHDAEEQAVEALRTAEAITVPSAPRLLADDATPEALATLMAQHGGRMSLLSAEGGVFDLMGGRYSRSRPNLDVYLKGHSGDSLRVDRQDRPPQVVDRACLTIGVTVQPGVLNDAAAVQQFQTRGLLARFLYSLPPSYVGERKINPPAVDAELADQYDRNVRALVASLAEWTDPAVLWLDEAAQAVLITYETTIEPRLAPYADLGAPLVVEWSSKLVGAVARLAGLLHLAEHLDSGWSQPVNVRTAHAACLLGDYYLGHARSLFVDMLDNNDTPRLAKAVLDWCVREQLTSFSRRDVHQSHRSRFATADDVDPVLDLLDETGWIRAARDDVTHSGRRGRPHSPRYEVNPAVKLLTPNHSQTLLSDNETTDEPPF